MPALYGFTGNANVAVGNTVGLYQQNTGVTQVLSSAQLLLSLLSNASTVGFSLTNANTQVQGTVVPSGVSAGTYGSSTLIPIITVGADGRVTTLSTVTVPTQSGTYSNTNVAAYLTGTVTVGNLITTAGVYWANGQPYSSGASFYSNANVAAYLPTYTGSLELSSSIISLNANVAGANAAQIAANTIQSNQIQAISANLGGFETYANATYSTISNAASLQTQINSTNSNVVAVNVAIASTNANLSAFELYANSTFQTGGSSSYGNSNVNAYLSTGLVTTIKTTGNIQTTTGYFLGDGSLLTNMYGNTNVNNYINSNTNTTIQSLNANTTQQQAQINSINANVLAANTNISTLTTNLQTLNANVGGFEIYANATYSTIANAGSLQNQITGANVNIQNISANLGGFETYANATFQTAASAYSNVNAAAYLTTATITTTGNITAANLTTAGNVSASYVKANAALLTSLTGAAAGVYGSDTTIPSIQVDATGRILSITTNVSAGGGSYGNANVSAYLPVFSGNVGATNVVTVGVTATGNITTTGNIVSPGYLYPNGVSIISGIAGTYSNANVSAYLPGYTGSVGTLGGPVSSGYYGRVGIFYDSLTVGGAATAYMNGVTDFTAGRVTGFASIGGGDLWENRNANVQATSGWFVGNASGTRATYSGAVTAGNLITTNGVFWANGTAYSSGGGTTYSNTNVAAYLTTATISTSGNITGANLTTAGNVTASYVKGNGSLLTNLPVQPGTYTNSNVTNLLSGGTYTGDVIATTGVVNASAINSSGSLTAGSYLQANNGLYSINTFSGTYSDGIVVDYVTGNGRISVGTADNLTFYTGGVGATPTLQLASNGAAIAGNLITTNGVFWANGTAYSTGGTGGVTSITAGTGITANAATGAVSITNAGVTAIVVGTGITANAATGVVSISSTGSSSAFSGNLAGNTLIDSINGRVIVNASPFSSPSISAPLWTNIQNNNPVYVSGVLQPAAQVTGGTTTAPYFNAAVQQTTANLALQSSYQTTTNRFTSGKIDYTQVWPVTANSMTSSDRWRGVSTLSEVMLNNTTWGTGISQLSAAASAGFNTLNVVGSGTMGPVAGLQNLTYVTPNGTAAGSGLVANINYVTGINGSVQFLTTYGTNQTANVTYARGFIAVITTGSSNHVITNAVGYHTPSGWVTAPGGNGAGITNRYSLLNEDSNSLIQTNANIQFAAGSGKSLVFGDGTSISTAPSSVSTGNITFNQTTIASNSTTTLPVIIKNTANGVSQASNVFSQLSYWQNASDIQYGNVYTGYGIGSTIFAADLTPYAWNGSISGPGVLFTVNGTSPDPSNSSSVLMGYDKTGNLTLSPFTPSTGGIVFPDGSFQNKAATTFTGNLAGNVLYDSVNQRFFANAYPLSTPLAGPWSSIMASTLNPVPVYVSGVLQPQGTSTQNVSGQTFGGVLSANIGLQSAYGAGGAKNNVGFLQYVQVTPVTANTMNTNDRIRAVNNVLDINLNGKTWGVMSSGSQSAVFATGQLGQTQVLGSGSISSIIGMTGGINIFPDPNGTANVQYASTIHGTVNLQSNVTNAAANLVYGRLISGIVQGFTSNLTVQNAVGLHLINGWAGSGVVGAASNPLFGRYAILNEDANTTIQTAGNIVFKATATTGLNSTGVFTVAALTAITGVVGQFAAVSNGTGKNNGQLAYWDVTNTRWSWVDTNLAVS